VGTMQNMNDLDNVFADAINGQEGSARKDKLAGAQSIEQASRLLPARAPPYQEPETEKNAIFRFSPVAVFSATLRLPGGLFISEWIRI
jgi:hypothetical protein